MRAPESDKFGLTTLTLTGSAAVLGASVVVAGFLYSHGQAWPEGGPAGGFLAFLLALGSFAWVTVGFFLMMWVPLWLLLSWFLRLQAGSRIVHERFERDKESVGTRLSVAFWGLAFVAIFSLVVPNLHERRWGAGSLAERVSSEWASVSEHWLVQVRRFFAGAVATRFASGRLHVLVAGDLVRVGGWEPAGFLRRPILLNLVRERDVLMRALEEAEEATPGQVLFFSGGRLQDGSTVLDTWRTDDVLESGGWKPALFQSVPFLLGWLWFVDHVPGLREIFPSFLEVSTDDRRLLNRLADELAGLPSDFSGTVVVFLREGVESEAGVRGESIELDSEQKDALPSPHRASRTRQTGELLRRTLNTFDFGQTVLSPVRDVSSQSQAEVGSSDVGHFSVVYADRLPSPEVSSSDWTLFQSGTQKFLSWSADTPCHVLPLVPELEERTSHDLERSGVREPRSWSAQEAVLAERLRQRPTVWCVTGEKDRPDRVPLKGRMLVGALKSGADGAMHDGLANVVEWITPERRVVRRSDPLRKSSDRHAGRNEWGDAELPEIVLYEAHWTSEEPDVTWRRVGASERAVLLQEWLSALLVNPSQVADDLAQILGSRAFGG